MTKTCLKQGSCLERRDVLQLLSAALVQAAFTTAAQAAAEATVFLPLTEKIEVSFDKLKKPWLPVAFEMHFLSPDGEKRLAPGIAMCLGDGTVHAFCLFCGHQLCFVEPPLANSSPKVFFCPCHNSRYDTAGARVSGPTERGLFQLQTVLTDNSIGVLGIEAALAERLTLGPG